MIKSITSGLGCWSS